jgi:hypothetical protein
LPGSRERAYNRLIPIQLLPSPQKAQTMTTQSMRFGHFGINCFDIAAMERYVDSPWYTPQPCGEPFDLSLSDAEIHRQTEALCRSRPGFEPTEVWRARLAEKIRARLSDINSR